MWLLKNNFAASFNSVSAEELTRFLATKYSGNPPVYEKESDELLTSPGTYSGQVNALLNGLHAQVQNLLVGIDKTAAEGYIETLKVRILVEDNYYHLSSDLHESIFLKEVKQLLEFTAYSLQKSTTRPSKEKY